MGIHDPLERPPGGWKDPETVPEPRLAMPVMPPLRLIASLERLWRRRRMARR
ncbi:MULTISPECIES: hypothetical protein [Alcanivorax]|uniref:hypothetical protein n=1 Tax=Alcanivorax TaxID=59753 RepID=UPI0013587305|nr:MULTISPECIES: hypothetical protein [Alcanivorax]